VLLDDTLDMAVRRDLPVNEVPEVPTVLDGAVGVLEHVVRLLDRQGHAVVVVAGGAGQDLFDDGPVGRDASGNTKPADIGALLRERITAHVQDTGRELSLRYVDPGYAIRSVPATGSRSQVEGASLRRRAPRGRRGAGAARWSAAAARRASPCRRPRARRSAGRRRPR
jgi:6-phosphofructokinase 1